jgi:ribosomal protein S18 acetylase RimI-like enzyme
MWDSFSPQGRIAISALLSPNIVIRPVLSDDLSSIVDMHVECFPDSFLTSLGNDFLDLVYQSIVEDPGGLFLIAFSGMQLAGFAAGVTGQMSFYSRSIADRKWAFALAGLGALFKNPAIAPRMVRALKRPSEVRQASTDACLMSLGVLPELRRRGIGSRLVRAFCHELVRRDTHAVCLTTDKDETEGANNFYLGLGFKVSREIITPEGRGMNEYLLTLSQATVTSPVA